MMGVYRATAGANVVILRTSDKDVRRISTLNEPKYDPSVLSLPLYLNIKKKQRWYFLLNT
jgi:hypothetical protein